MKLSIYIPALERDALFDRCLRSIRRSIAAAGSDAFAANDYEIVVVDGISPVAAARNEALRRMSGEWITCVDADDEVTGGWFREICRAIAAAERNGGIDDIVFDMTVVHGTGETELQYGRESVVETATLVDDMLRDMRLGGHAVRHVMRRSLWADDRFELLPALEDYVTLPRVLARARKIAYIAKPLYRYIVRPGSLSNGSAESRCAAFVTAVYQAESFGGAANIGTMVCAYNLLYDRIGMNGAARRWIRHHLLQALCDFEVPIKWKVKFALAALGVIVRRPCVIKWIREVGFFRGPTLVCFGALFLVVAGISLVVGFRNGLSGPYDFQWSTAKALLDGVDPYAARIGGESYACYAPSCLLLLAPWTVLSRGSALVAWLLANIIFMLVFLALMCRMYVAEGARVRWFAWLSLVMLFSLPFRQLLECGQHIGFSLVFFALTLWYWRKGRWLVAGLCLVPALFKYTSMVPISAVFIGLGAWRVIGVAALGHGVLTILASVLTRTDPVTLIVGSMRIGMGNAGQGISDLASFVSALGLHGGAYAAIVGYALSTFAISVVVVRLRDCRIGRDDELCAIATLAAISCFMFYHRLYDYLVLMIVPFVLSRLSMFQRIFSLLALFWFFVGFRVHVAFASHASGVVVSVVMILILILVLCKGAKADEIVVN